MSKSAEAFRTISEVADWLNIPTHVLRFWESKFAQVKPVKRAGGRRYYRPRDMLLIGGIKRLLHDDGMTIKGAQKIIREKGVAYVASLSQPLDGVTFQESADDIADELDTVETPVENVDQNPALPADQFDLFTAAPTTQPEPLQRENLWAVPDIDPEPQPTPISAVEIIEFPIVEPCFDDIVSALENPKQIEQVDQNTLKSLLKQLGEQIDRRSA